MVDQQYFAGRKRYARPQAMLWSNNLGTLINESYIPNGYEIGGEYPVGTDSSLIDQFLVLSDHNRSELQFSSERIESRRRMINGSMRSYHIADKLALSTSWNMLPSRSYKQNPNFDDTIGISEDYWRTQDEYTVDGGAGGVDILDWYENHKGPFWVFLSYDKYTVYGREEQDYQKLGQYTQVIKMYFKDFSYNIVKRGQNNFDLWNINLTLEEA
jgi:hypothetical protein